MRLRAILFAVAALAAVVWASWDIAVRATAWFERATAAELDGALAAAGLDWTGDRHGRAGGDACRARRRTRRAGFAPTRSSTRS